MAQRHVDDQQHLALARPPVSHRYLNPPPHALGKARRAKFKRWTARSRACP